MKRRPYFLWILGVVVLVIAIGLVVDFSQVPRNDRVWAPEFSKLNTVNANPDGSVVVHNVRDWTYDGTTVSKEAWLDQSVNTANIESAWFFLDRFSSSTLIAHTFLSFEEKDGNTIAFSIEARREASEQYSEIGGFLRTFELQYLWGTERDFIPERATFGENPLFMYKLKISATDAQALFTSLTEETNTLAAHPRFYNTLTANCTNLLAEIVNEHYPHTLPYDIAWNLTGLSDRYLMRQGFIDTSGSTEALVEERADLTRYRSEIAGLATSTTANFSVSLRKLTGNK